MSKPLMILDQHFRSVDELFARDTYARLGDICRIEGGQDAPMDPTEISSLLPQAQFLVAARPEVGPEELERAPQLKTIIEVSGAFHPEIDYEACFAAGVEILSCAPGFRQSVAEMGLSMLLAAARGLVAEHEAFRAGRETWLDDRPKTDFTLFGQKIGFVGYGNIAREMHGLLAPFRPNVMAYDPWLTAFPDGVTPMDLPELFSTCRAVVVTAVPNADNHKLVSAELIDLMPSGAALIMLSRAHVIDFDAAVRAADAGRITFATDVFPSEPVVEDDPMRQADQVIFSPHRAAAVPNGRQLIGEFILHDVEAILDGRKERQLLAADPDRVSGLVGAQLEIEKAGKLAAT